VQLKGHGSNCAETAHLQYSQPTYRTHHHVQVEVTVLPQWVVVMLHKQQHWVR
jgi:hypothetical protein